MKGKASLREAKRRSNPDLLRGLMDCFASLAMTALGEALFHPRPTNGILLAMTVMNSTLASSGRLAM